MKTITLQIFTFIAKLTFGYFLGSYVVDKNQFDFNIALAAILVIIALNIEINTTKTRNK